MDATKKTKIPQLCAHKATGQSFIRIDGRAIYFGKTGLPETTQKYHQFIAEWLASGCPSHSEPEQVTVNELCARFWVHAERYYVKADGTFTSEIDCYRSALKPLLELYGHSGAMDFGPKALKLVRQKMIEMGWNRKTINKHIGRIRTIFRWAGENELVPGTVHHALQTVAGLRAGRSAAKESIPVKPAPQPHVDAVEPFVSGQVWAVIQLQLLTAARPGEILQMRPCDVDTSGGIWMYCPGDHKTAYHGFERTIYMGPRAQEILSPFLLRPAEIYCFSPAEAEAVRRINQYQNRKTPMHRGNVPGSNYKEDPQWRPNERYTVATYRRAIARAIEAAFPPPEHLAQQPGESKAKWQQRLTKKQREELKAWCKQFHWHPHQLRHNAATFLRKEFGLETARIILGHRSAAITEVYAELDQQKAMEAIVRVG